MERLALYLFLAWFMCGWAGGTAYALGDLGAPILVQGLTKHKTKNRRATRGPPPISFSYNNGTAMQRDKNGTLHLLWADDGDLLYGRKPKGAEFTHQLLKRGAQRLPVLGVDGVGGIVVVYRMKMGLFAMTSDDAGETFGKVVQLSKGDVFAPTLRVWSNGVGKDQQTWGVVAWHSKSKSKDTTVYAANLVEGVFQEPVRLEYDGAASEFVTIGGYKGESIVVWREKQADSRGWELYMSQQSSPSAVWSNPVKIGEGLDPSVCVTDKGEVHLAYQARMQVFYRRSEDKGKTWLDAVRLGDGLFAKVSCNDIGGIAIAWENMRYRSKADIGTLAKNNKAKTVGLATSTDHGRHIVSSIPFDRKSLMFASVEVDRQMQTIDLLFFDEEDMTVRVHRTEL
jgi:hypothetical protein